MAPQVGAPESSQLGRMPNDPAKPRGGKAESRRLDSICDQLREGTLHPLDIAARNAVYFFRVDGVKYYPAYINRSHPAAFYVEGAALDRQDREWEDRAEEIFQRGYPQSPAEQGLTDRTVSYGNVKYGDDLPVWGPDARPRSPSPVPTPRSYKEGPPERTLFASGVAQTNRLTPRPKTPNRVSRPRVAERPPQVCDDLSVRSPGTTPPRPASASTISLPRRSRSLPPSWRKTKEEPSRSPSLSRSPNQANREQLPTKTPELPQQEDRKVTPPFSPLPQAEQRLRAPEPVGTFSPPPQDEQRLRAPELVSLLRRCCRRRETLHLLQPRIRETVLGALGR